ncbi:uncharacterized protein C8Q71DRAFT_711329 [Rhodofomes roseus]|uniref:Fungal-type protein kinase domain-containing protein n=1 Tax=Rhodofomes roseus TaxID=34475 RepID=A0ABQ8KAJ3_9APHY|nr:uncharacterized protein C8Q71DRAFT_711329 [Rhodofomes roseus]KAH9834468.1 hypothetical protein C8Q71DRAFT_711329 [Rhodofomes roseus]
MLQLRFPYEPFFEKNPRGNLLVKPDVVALIPGQDKTRGDQPDVWSNFSLSIDVRAMSSPDHTSIVAAGDPEAVRTRMRLMRMAGHHLSEHNALCSFVLSVRGSQMQVYRFDRVACIVSPAFDYTADPDLLRQFLWAFVHPAKGTAFFGLDEYMASATEADMRWATEVSGDAWRESDVDYNRWIRIPSEDSEEPEMEFLTLRLRCRGETLYSGVTTVWEALKRGDSSGNRYIIKDTWQPVNVEEERHFYERILRCNQDLRDQPFGVAGYVRGVNYGLLVGSGAGSLHRTMSARLRGRWGGAEERNHVRIVVDTVGKTLRHFEHSRDLMEAIRDAIRGHLVAYKAGVLHGDISEGNILMAKGKPFKGFIHDFDLSAWIDSTADGGLEVPIDKLTASVWQRKPLMGTPRFMAIELLESLKDGALARTASFDLQGFYWLALREVICYTNYYVGDADEVAHELFTGAYTEMTKNKRKWLSKDTRSLFTGNPPLVFLLGRLQDLVVQSVPGHGNSSLVRLTHEAVLAVFDEALAMDGWRDNDRAKPMDARRRLGAPVVAGAGPKGLRHTEPLPQEREGRRDDLKRKRVREEDNEGGPSSPSKRRRRSGAGRKKDKAPAGRPRAANSGPAPRPRGGGNPQNDRPDAMQLMTRIMPDRVCGMWMSLLRR